MNIKKHMNTFFTSLLSLLVAGSLLGFAVQASQGAGHVQRITSAPLETVFAKDGEEAAPLQQGSAIVGAGKLSVDGFNTVTFDDEAVATLTLSEGIEKPAILQRLSLTLEKGRAFAFVGLGGSSIEIENSFAKVQALAGGVQVSTGTNIDGAENMEVTVVSGGALLTTMENSYARTFTVLTPGQKISLTEDDAAKLHANNEKTASAFVVEGQDTWGAHQEIAAIESINEVLTSFRSKLESAENDSVIAKAKNTLTVVPAAKERSAEHIALHRLQNAMKNGGAVAVDSTINEEIYAKYLPFARVLLHRDLPTPTRTLIAQLNAIEADIAKAANLTALDTNAQSSLYLAWILLHPNTHEAVEKYVEAQNTTGAQAVMEGATISSLVRASKLTVESDMAEKLAGLLPLENDSYTQALMRELLTLAQFWGTNGKRVHTTAISDALMALTDNVTDDALLAGITELELVASFLALSQEDAPINTAQFVAWKEKELARRVNADRIAARAALEEARRQKIEEARLLAEEEAKRQAEEEALKRQQEEVVKEIDITLEERLVAIEESKKENPIIKRPNARLRNIPVQ